MEFPVFDNLSDSARNILWRPSGLWDAIKRRVRPAAAGGLLDAKGAAELLGVGEEQLRAFVKSGELRYVNVGQGSKCPRYRFDPADLARLIRERAHERLASVV
jgi:hypothetical protein